MITGEFVRGRYYRDGREIANLPEEGAAMMVDAHCHFCGSESTSMLLLSDPEIGKAYAVPACACIKNVLPKKKEDLVEWANAQDFSEVPFFELKPGPVLRIDRPPYLIQKAMGELPVDIQGQVVDLAPSEAIIFDCFGKTTVYFVQQGIVGLFEQERQWMDSVLEFGPIDMPDAQELANALVGENETHKAWAKELLYNRVNARYNNRLSRERGDGLLGALMNLIGAGGDEDCDCAICVAKREAASNDE